MLWTEEAIVLSARKFGESGLLIEVFARGRGLYSGLVRGGQSKTKLNIFQPGNIIEATWRSRLEDQLGTFSAEPLHAVSAKVIHDHIKLLGLLSLTALLRKTLIDRHPYDDLYQHHVEYLTHTLHEDAWLTEYVWMEVALLRYLGFGLDLSVCAVTGATEGLKYLSPRTGRAVTAEGGKGYEAQLLSLPKFMLDGNLEDEAEILVALQITEYFIARNLFSPHERKVPDERQRFFSALKKHLQTRVNSGILRENA